jgi:hypothetical protein
MYENSRDVKIITHKIIKIIPDDQPELINKLQIFVNSLWNKAPEERFNSYLWNELCFILNNNIISFDLDWKKRIKDIVNNKIQE